MNVDRYKKLLEELEIIKDNLRSQIFDKLGCNIADLIGTTDAIGDKELNELEKAQEQLTDIITDIKLKYG